MIRVERHRPGRGGIVVGVGGVGAGRREEVSTLVFVMLAWPTDLVQESRGMSRN